MKNTKIISAFPGTGKTHLFNNTNLFVLDSDSSYFDKTNFPKNYIEHIKSYIGKVDYILVSSHEDVRDELIRNKIDFLLIYPDESLKNEYIERYKMRGSSDGFINLISANWDKWISDCSGQRRCLNIKLPSGKFISDVI